MIDHYYAPAADGAKELPYEFTSCEHVFFSTGPNEAIELDNNHIAVSVLNSGRDRNVSYISAGPAILPVIPVFPINWFISDETDFVTLRIHVRVKKNANVKWKIRDTVIVMPDNNVIQPTNYYSYKEREKIRLPVDSDTALDLQSWWWNVYLRYPMSVKTTSTFHLSLLGFLIDDGPIVLPDIQFRKASSWKMCGAP